MSPKGSYKLPSPSLTTESASSSDGYRTKKSINDHVNNIHNDLEKRHHSSIFQLNISTTEKKNQRSHAGVWRTIAAPPTLDKTERTTNHITEPYYRKKSNRNASMWVCRLNSFCPRANIHDYLLRSRFFFRTIVI
ncbi:hypothetical protein AVEN_193019-1 [Araneus ventricosus]|uniref:Uncharacterized protein n=1 Tax=Araneus ventricosus TaxID=182803 RepID=A0A4Y2E6V5_ARAVE|nr:hypothetical protein AVEN_23525-1 [Araneus ventricosus]GBM94535.1 hypothetical protein AVEN_193019-1 [Araneus ventricosus]